MDILTFILTTLGWGITCSMPGVVMGQLLASKGIVRDRSIWVVGGSICGLLFGRLVLPSAPLSWLVVIFLILSPLGMYRDDLWTTFRRGKWWWVKGSNDSRPIPTLIVGIILAIGVVMVILTFVIYPQR